MRLRKNGVPVPGRRLVRRDGRRPRPRRGRAGWLDKSDIVEGQIVVVHGGRRDVPQGPELDSDVVAELATDSRAHGAGRAAASCAPGLLARRGRSRPGASRRSATAPAIY